MHSGPPHEVRRLDSLDALRGLAALSVLVFHTALVPNPQLAVPGWMALVVNNAGSGVALFFVVSAFSLAYTMPLRQRDEHPWRSFFLHRFFRIAPLFFVWILASLVRDWFHWDKVHTVGEIAASVTFTQNLVPGGQEGFVWASWTIGVEMLFYAMFPLFWFLARDLGRAVAVFFGTVVLWLVVDALTRYLPIAEPVRAQFMQWSVLRHLPVFACGLVAFHFLMPHFASTRPDAPPRDASGLGAALVMGFVLGYAGFLLGRLPNLFGSMYVWQGVVFAMLVVGLALWPVRAIVNRFTAYLGKISYSFYLNHPTVVFYLSPVYYAIDAGGRTNTTVAFLACVALTIACTLAVSALTYRFIEEPGMALGRRVVARWSPRKPVAPAPAPAAAVPRIERASEAAQV